jgi:hypothetical protein
LARLWVDEMMRIIVQSKSIVQKLRQRHHPGGVRTQASFQHPAVMFQYGVDRTDCRPLFPLQLVAVAVLAAVVTEFLVYPAPQWPLTEETGG